MKILLEVTTPGNGKTYDFILDGAMTVGQVKQTMINEIIETENGNITLIPENTILGSLSGKTLLNDSETLEIAGVRSGQRLILL